jgi:SAM-dependent methyltransferase
MRIPAANWEANHLTWEATLFKKTQLGIHRHCLALLESYARSAPAWERYCLAAYVSIGSAVARCLGVDTATIWRNAESITDDIMVASCLSPHGVIELLRTYVKLRREGINHLPFEQARMDIYDQPFYPVVTHFTFALQPSAIARLRFVREIVAAMTDGPAAAADLGCGSGFILTEVLLSKPSWIGHGLDISAECVEYAKRLAAHKRIGERVEFTAEDIAQLPYEDGSLDLVIVSEVLEHVPEGGRVLAGIARVLRPGGQLVLTIPLESHTPAHLQTFRSPEELLSLCEAAGLSIKRAEPQWHFGFGDDRKHLFALMENCADTWVYAMVPESVADEAVQRSVPWE